MINELRKLIGSYLLELALAVYPDPDSSELAMTLYPLFAAWSKK